MHYFPKPTHYVWISQESFRKTLWGLFESYKMTLFLVHLLFGYFCVSVTLVKLCGATTTGSIAGRRNWASCLVWASLQSQKGIQRDCWHPWKHQKWKKRQDGNVGFGNSSNSLSKRHQKIALNRYPCQEIKERFRKRMREMDLTAKCYRRFLQPPSPSPERQTSRDSQDYF